MRPGDCSNQPAEKLEWIRTQRERGRRTRIVLRNGIRRARLRFREPIVRKRADARTKDDAPTDEQIQ